MNGVLVIDKPRGPTSHDVVARVRRAIGLRRIGHTGTLDPLATGVLPLVVGRATRLAQFFSGEDKEYVAEVRLGMATSTYDAEGRPESHAGGALNAFDVEIPESITPETLDEILREFRGTYWQMPPPFSAKKVAGAPAYRLARLNKPVKLEPVQVTVGEIEILACYRDLIRVRLVCSTGFYVRTFAHELGQRLECGAFLDALQRTRSGQFARPDAVPLEIIEAEGRAALRRLIPMPRLLPNLPEVVVTDRGARRAAHGNAIAPEDVTEPLQAHPTWADPTMPVRLKDAEGTLLAVAHRVQDGLLHPYIVLV
jgi:tRNA pseudouridine55 synthase